MSKLEMVNRLFQFTFFRIFYYADTDGTTGYGILGPVLPLTGWSIHYIPEPRFFWKLSANTKRED